MTLNEINYHETKTQHMDTITKARYYQALAFKADEFAQLLVGRSKYNQLDKAEYCANKAAMFYGTLHQRTRFAK
jgi:hypothetical protein